MLNDDNRAVRKPARPTASARSNSRQKLDAHDQDFITAAEARAEAAYLALHALLRRIPGACARA